MRTSTPPWPATSAAAARITAFARLSSTRRRRLEMSRGLLEAGRHAASAGFSRRSFLKLGLTAGVTASGGFLLGFSMPVASQDQAKGKSIIGGDGIELPQDGVFAPNAFVQ